MSCLISPMLTLTWDTDILFGKLRPETGGMNLKITLCTMPPSLAPGWGFHAKPFFFFNIFSGDPHVDDLNIGLY